MSRISLLAASLAFCGLFAADFPEADIASGAVRAKVYLPDTENGYYRATRFDWAGVIPSLEFRAHQYFGQWFEKYDPKLHDAIMGPVEEFLPGDAWTQAKPGATVVKIGVGVVRKPDASAYQFSKTYELVDPGKWAVQKAPDQVDFVQEVSDPGSGCAYVYHKTVRLAKDKPDLILEHTLRNTGQNTIDTKVYDHNFFVIDQQPSGPDFLIRFPFDLLASGGDLKNMVQLRASELAYLRVLKPGETVYAHLEGFGDTPKDYNIRLENMKTGAGVRVTADQPLADLAFWSARTTLCPEAFLKVHVEPGAEQRWNITYHFYALSVAGRE